MIGAEFTATKQEIFLYRFAGLSASKVKITG
jgi:hypothetical protein